MMFDKVLNTFLQFILQQAYEVSQLEILATICLFKFTNIFHLNLSEIVHCQIQKQQPEVLCKKRCSQKCYRKTPVPESLINKVRPQSATLLRKKFWYRCFSVNFTKFLRKRFLQNTSGRQRLQIHVALCSTYLLNDKNYMFPDYMFLQNVSCLSHLLLSICWF